MYKIATLIALNSDCRFMSLLAEGLIQHPDVESSFNTPVVQCGKVLAKGSLDFEKDLETCDYILRPIDGYTGRMQSNHVQCIDKKNLWDKVIIYDPKDEPWEVDEKSLDKARVYFKRSFPPIKKYQKPIYPTNLGVLSCYVTNPAKRTIDVATYYSRWRLAEAPHLYRERVFLFNMLTHEVDWTGYTTIFDQAYAHRPSKGTVGDAVCTDDPKGTPEGQRWIDYHNNLGRTKIMFTAWPTRHDQDNRTWEALAAGTFCFIGKTKHPVWGLEHGKHCYIYDPSDRESIMEAIEKAKYLLSPRGESERRRVARAGKKFVFDNHMGINRINDILNVMILKGVRK